MTKILLVEDDKSLREIYGVRLLAEGYDIVSAGDGEEALAMAIKEKPSLIISDVMMPKISGFDMLDILRSTTETKNIKVVMMTALSSDDQRARGEQLGADRYLVKSQVGIEDVVRTVHEVLEDTTGLPAQPETETPFAPGGSSLPPQFEVSSSDGAAGVNEVQTQPPSSVNPPEQTVENSPPEVTAQLPELTESVSAAPGNYDAGPLPPQPSETELLESIPEVSNENILQSNPVNNIDINTQVAPEESQETNVAVPPDLEKTAPDIMNQTPEQVIDEPSASDSSFSSSVNNTNEENFDSTDVVNSKKSISSSGLNLDVPVSDESGSQTASENSALPKIDNTQTDSGENSDASLLDLSQPIDQESNPTPNNPQ